MTPRLRILEQDDETQEDMNARHQRVLDDDLEQRRQVEGAVDLLAIPPERRHRFPWRALHRTIGTTNPGDVVIVCAASGGGKTEFVQNVALNEIDVGRRVMLVSLEVTAEHTRLMFAARSCGFHPAMVLRGELTETQEVTVVKALNAQNVDLLRLAPYPTLDARVVREVGQTAAATGCRLIILDHIDHVAETPQQTALGASLEVTTALLEIAKRYEIPILATSQLNVSGRGGDRLASYRPVRLESVKYGGRKVEIAATVLGLYRPLREGLTTEEERKVKDGFQDDVTILEPNAVALNVLKCRNDGTATGKRIKLRWNQGRIIDTTEPS